MIWPNRDELIGTRLGVTTSRGASRELVEKAATLAENYGLFFIPRQGLGREKLLARYEEKIADGLLVVHEEGVSLCTADGRLFFHPSMALVRIKRLMAGEEDRLAVASAVVEGDTVLDCTLGLGADAIVFSYLVGEKGRVVGLERSLGLAIIVREGLKHYRSGLLPVDRAMRRIEVVAADHRGYLSRHKEERFEIIYFDPLFRRPIVSSTHLQAFRPLADPTPLSPVTIGQAVAMARKRVVLKERRGSPEFARLGFSHILESTSRVAYGWLPGEGGQAR